MKPLPRNRSLVVWRKHYVKSGAKKRIRTICEVLRELHREAESRGDAVAMTKLEEATDMAKRMQNRLEFYSLKMKMGKRVYLSVDDVGRMVWLAKSEFK